MFTWIKNIVSTIFGSDEKQNGYAWWVKINTDKPVCTYYFGPFDNSDEARSHQGGYIEDLKNEGADVFTPQIQWCKPEKLTIYDEESVSEGKAAVR